MYPSQAVSQFQSAFLSVVQLCIVRCKRDQTFPTVKFANDVHTTLPGDSDEMPGKRCSNCISFNVQCTHVEALNVRCTSCNAVPVDADVALSTQSMGSAKGQVPSFPTRCAFC